MRKPVGALERSDLTLVVVCDDGTVWVHRWRDPGDGNWKYVWEETGPPIPESPAALAASEPEDEAPVVEWVPLDAPELEARRILDYWPCAEAYAAARALLERMAT